MRDIARVVTRGVLELDVDVPTRVTAEAVDRADHHAVGEAGAAGDIAHVSVVHPADCHAVDDDVESQALPTARRAGDLAEAHVGAREVDLQPDLITLAECVEVRSPVTTTRRVMHRRVAGVAVRPRRVDVGVVRPLTGERHADDGLVRLGRCRGGIGALGDDESQQHRQTGEERDDGPSGRACTTSELNAQGRLLGLC